MAEAGRNAERERALVAALERLNAHNVGQKADAVRALGLEDDDDLRAISCTLHATAVSTGEAGACAELAWCLLGLHAPQGRLTMRRAVTLECERQFVKRFAPRLAGGRALGSLGRCSRDTDLAALRFWGRLFQRRVLSDKSISVVFKTLAEGLCPTTAECLCTLLLLLWEDFPGLKNKNNRYVMALLHFWDHMDSFLVHELRQEFRDSMHQLLLLAGDSKRLKEGQARKLLKISPRRRVRTVSYAGPGTSWSCPDDDEVYDVCDISGVVASCEELTIGSLDPTVGTLESMSVTRQRLHRATWRKMCNTVAKKS